MRIETRVDPYRDEDDAERPGRASATIPLGENVLVALKAWRLRSKFKQPDRSCLSQQEGRVLQPPRHGEAEIPLPCSPRRLPRAGSKSAVTTRSKLSRGMRSGILRFLTGSMQAFPPASRPWQTFAGHSSLPGHHGPLRPFDLFWSDDHGRVMDAIANEIYTGSEPDRPMTYPRNQKSERTLG